MDECLPGGASAAPLSLLALMPLPERAGRDPGAAGGSGSGSGSGSKA
ncbi:hypothetical protein [Streptomyces scabiei]|nr:hypothetical protein [Streptomyces scabiei]